MCSYTRYMQLHSPYSLYAAMLAILAICGYTRYMRRSMRLYSPYSLYAAILAILATCGYTRYTRYMRLYSLYAAILAICAAILAILAICGYTRYIRYMRLYLLYAAIKLYAPRPLCGQGSQKGAPVPRRHPGVPRRMLYADHCFCELGWGLAGRVPRVSCQYIQIVLYEYGVHRHVCVCLYKC